MIEGFLNNFHPLDPVGNLCTFSEKRVSEVRH